MSGAGQGGVETGMGTQSLRQFEQAAMDSRLITVNSTAPKLMTLDPLQNFMVKTRGPTHHPDRWLCGCCMNEMRDSVTCAMNLWC